MFFSGIVSLQYHPRNTDADRKSIAVCAEVADHMYAEFLRRFKEDVCRGS